MYPIRSIIIEGIDRLGKDTLIQGVMNRLGFFKVLHYQKPELLDINVADAQRSLGTPELNDTVKRAALKAYQADSFRNMFRLLASDSKLILNRAHLGEMVYAPRYRKYDGNYVLDIEKSIADDMGSNVLDTTLLVLLHASDTSFLVDDGKSFDFAAKESEQVDFMRAFERSHIRHKLLVDVSVDGSYVPADLIANVVTAAYEKIQTLQYPVWSVYWTKGINGELEQVNELSPDPKTLIK